MKQEKKREKSKGAGEQENKGSNKRSEFRGLRNQEEASSN